METLASFLVRNPKVAERHPQWVKQYPDIPYSFNRKAYPTYYLTANQYKNLFRRGYPQRQPNGFFYDRRSHRLLALYDCKREIAGLLNAEHS